MRSVLRHLATLPFSILHAADRLYERVLSLVASKQLSSRGRTDYIRRNAVRTQLVEHSTTDGHTFKARFFVPNEVCQYRATTFSTKEPEILKWIDEYRDDGSLFDIGANIGLYSVYFAKTKPGRVYAFEPSVFNVGQLAKNLSINNLSDKVLVIPNPLSAENGVAQFSIAKEDEGGAMNAFGVDYGFDGKRLSTVAVKFGLLGFKLDYLIESGLIDERPALMKIDVDGIEPLILKGAKRTLSGSACRSVFVEVNDDFSSQADSVTEILAECGFVLERKAQSELIGRSETVGRSYNQIWRKE